MSTFAKALFYRYDIVIAHDIDEYLVVDPNQNQSLADYLQRPVRTASISALGLDVGQHLEKEQAIDSSKPFLEQREFAQVSARYTKPIVANKPITWGSGFHRVKGRNFRIDPNLYLFHFGMVDFEKSSKKIGSPALSKAGWAGHLERRNQLFDTITRGNAVDGDDFLFEICMDLNQEGRLEIYDLSHEGQPMAIDRFLRKLCESQPQVVEVVNCD